MNIVQYMAIDQNEEEKLFLSKFLYDKDTVQDLSHKDQVLTIIDFMNQLVSFDLEILVHENLQVYKFLQDYEEVLKAENLPDL